jgi:hypothetical protein
MSDSAAIAPVPQDAILAKLRPAVAALAECQDIATAKKIADIARAAEVYAQRQKLGEEAEAYAHAIKVDAMTLMGELLKETEKATGGERGGRAAKDGSRKEPSFAAPTLAEVGISKKESMQAQALATIRDEEPELFEEVRAGKVTVEKARKKVAKAKPAQAKSKGAKSRARKQEKEEEENIRTAYLLRANAALELANLGYSGPVTREIVNAARRAAAAWAKLITTLEAAL